MPPSITLDAERRIAASPEQARAAVVAVLHRSGFQLTADLATVVEAQRGSAVRAAMMVPDQMPVLVRMNVLPDTGPQAAVVRVHFSDRAVSTAIVGVQEPFQQAFLSTLGALDAALADLVPGTPPGRFPAPRLWSKQPSSDVAERGHAAGQRIVEGAVSAASAASGRLSGAARPSGPAGWAGITHVRFVSSAGLAVLDMPAVGALLAIPALIGSEQVAAGQAPSLPEALRAKVFELAALIETTLSQAAYAVHTVDIPGEHRLTFQFLHQQAAIRSQLPVRTLCICRDCKHAKVVNLDLKRLQTRNRRIKMLVSVLGVTAGRDNPNPFQVFSTVFRQAKLEPDFICTRCESTEAYERPVTFCPGCGDQRAEAVLTTCGKCGHDFRSLVQGARIWDAVPAVPPMPAAPPPPTMPPMPAAPPALAPVDGFGPPPVPYAAAPAPAPVPQPVPVLPQPWSAPPQANPYAQPAPAAVPAPAPTPGRHCAICGSPADVLWSVHVPRDGAWQQLGVCASTPACSPPPGAAPVRV
ncbi:hypothetical protein [Streptomyces sp. NRRL WC-3742]|uniref:hypothetical protein n=1 Tax=Streptomyces sp. NRRL WC-3742 TaxID=1463934 RepID=UPI0004C6851A|nr:hypothetical protein [Streptomyces sp. NRRL WC-3742]